MIIYAGKKCVRKKHLTSFQLIILGFAGVILLGSIFADASGFFFGQSADAIS